jgi:TolB protein
VLAPFDALRQRAAQLLGWDALSSLANAYVPVNEPLPPARLQDWLYTGRAFELHSQLITAGWMAVVPEQIDGQTYWRVFLKTAGDLGRPLVQIPWDFSARYNGNESEYQAGGEFAEDLPSGYWVDFTALAADYGFERVPALNNWRTYYQGARFNQFVLAAGLSWEAAMLQLHSPAEVATIQAISAP